MLNLASNLGKNLSFLAHFPYNRCCPFLFLFFLQVKKPSSPSFATVPTIIDCLGLVYHHLSLEPTSHNATFTNKPLSLNPLPHHFQPPSQKNPTTVATLWFVGLFSGQFSIYPWNGLNLYTSGWNFIVIQHINVSFLSVSLSPSHSILESLTLNRSCQIYEEDAIIWQCLCEKTSS